MIVQIMTVHSYFEFGNKSPHLFFIYFQLPWTIVLFCLFDRKRTEASCSLVISLIMWWRLEVLSSKSKFRALATTQSLMDKIFVLIIRVGLKNYL